jgi:cell division transport system permease protein
MPVSSNNSQRRPGGSLRSPPPAETAAATATPIRPAPPLEAFTAHHRLALIGAYRRLLRTPGATLLTLLVIGIALALPAALYVLIDNTQRLGERWDRTAQISVFLKTSIPEARAKQMAEQWRRKDGIKSVRYISRQAALEEFKRLSGSDEALAVLNDNPLPAVLVLQPAVAGSHAAKIEALLAELRRLPEVEVAQMDLDWLNKLYALLELAERLALFLGAVLVVTVSVIIGNTIRLMGRDYQQEIEISKLLGATDAYVRRPFLYTGLLLGLSGGAVAWLLVALALGWLNEAVTALSSLYRSSFALAGLSLPHGLLLMAAGGVLGIGAAYAAAQRYVRAMNPA